MGAEVGDVTVGEAGGAAVQRRKMEWSRGIKGKAAYSCDLKNLNLETPEWWRDFLQPQSTARVQTLPWRQGSRWEV